MLGAISGVLKSYCNVNEVISGIMLNWIVLYLDQYAADHGERGRAVPAGVAHLKGLVALRAAEFDHRVFGDFQVGHHRVVPEQGAQPDLPVLVSGGHESVQNHPVPFGQGSVTVGTADFSNNNFLLIVFPSRAAAPGVTLLTSRPWGVEFLLQFIDFQKNAILQNSAFPCRMSSAEWRNRELPKYCSFPGP